MKNKYSVICYCGEKLEIEHMGSVVCLVCGMLTRLSGTIQTTGKYRKFYFEEANGWLLRADFDERGRKQEELWRELVKKRKEVDIKINEGL